MSVRIFAAALILTGVDLLAVVALYTFGNYKRLAADQQRGLRDEFKTVLQHTSVKDLNRDGFAQLWQRAKKRADPNPESNDNLAQKYAKTLLQKTFDIGKAPNTIRSTRYSTTEEQRPIYIGTHPVPLDLLGRFGRWTQIYNDAVRHGKEDLEEGTTYPDPTHHWGVVVGDHFHELNAEWNLKVVYQNGLVQFPNPEVSKSKDEGRWTVFEVGRTRWSDEALRRAGEEVVSEMKESYNLFNNNCQVFTTRLVEKVCEPTAKQVVTGMLWVEERGSQIVMQHASEVPNALYPSAQVAAQRIMERFTPNATVKTNSTPTSASKSHEEEV